MPARRLRLSVTARLALLAIALSLASSLALIAVIRQQVASDALVILKQEIAEQAATYRGVARAGGRAALIRAVTAADEDDDDADTLIAGLYDDAGRRLAGSGPAKLAFALRTGAGVRIEPLANDADWGDREGAFIVQRVAGRWLVSGHLLDDRERGERAIERALLIALALSVVLGIAAGLVVTRYVTARLGRIADTADRVGAGDLSRRVRLSGGNDAFDRLGGRVNRMLDRVERLMGELRLVSDSLGHDLRSPLSRVRARIETALASDTTDGRDAALHTALADTDGLLRMLATLLQIGRSEATPRDRLVPTDPAALLAEVAEFYAPLVEEAGRTLALEVAGPSPPIPLHRELLSQALGNLIDNALKHGAGAITLALTNDPAGVMITVGDRGGGIAPDDRSVAVRRFGRLDPARSGPGAGLGLALVDAVARLHDGWIVLDDALPGLIVRLTLPVATNRAGGAALDSGAGRA